MSKEQTVAELAKSLAEAGLSAEQITQIITAKLSAVNSAVNTTSSIKGTGTPQIDINRAIQDARNKFKHEKLATVSIAVPYGTYTGGFLKVGINGTTIELPCDGKVYHVPESFAKEIKRRLNNLDIMYSEKGPELGETEVSSWAAKAGLAVGDIKVDEVSYK